MNQRGKKKNELKRNEDNLRDLQDNVKGPNIRIIGVPEEDKKKDHDGGLAVKNPPVKQEMWVRSLGWEESLEKEMASYSSIHAWEIPWTEDPGGL